VAQPFGAHCSAGLKEVYYETYLLSPVGAIFDSTQELLQRIGALFISFSKISGDEYCKLNGMISRHTLYVSTQLSNMNIHATGSLGETR
jgi:hypothetical protein